MSTPNSIVGEQYKSVAVLFGISARVFPAVLMKPELYVHELKCPILAYPRFYTGSQNIYLFFPPLWASAALEYSLGTDALHRRLSNHHGGAQLIPGFIPAIILFINGFFN
jgi:hypothetical protein